MFAGGGFRFGYYLGMHAAAVDTGNQPDILLASCGGAIAAAVIAALPDDRARRDWVSSPAMHRFLQAITSTPRAAVLPVARGLLHRQLRRAPAPCVPDLFHDYLFELPAALPLPAPDAHSPTSVAIVGARMLFRHSDVGRPREGRKLFRETVFCDARAATLLDGLASPLATGNDGDNAIAPGLETDPAMPVHDAVRISIADAYYFRCHSLSDSHYSGGLIDLFPVEIAHRLARHVVMERKAPFNRLYALPAVRAVFGIDGNARLRHVHADESATWIDTSDAAQALRHACVGKRIAWHSLRVHLDVPTSHAGFARQMDLQWQYGYRRAHAAFASRRAAEAGHLARETAA